MIYLQHIVHRAVIYGNFLFSRSKPFVLCNPDDHWENYFKWTSWLPKQKLCNHLCSGPHCHWNIHWKTSLPIFCTCKYQYPPKANIGSSQIQFVWPFLCLIPSAFYAAFSCITNLKALSAFQVEVRPLDDMWPKS